jgi:hypothetical protein
MLAGAALAALLAWVSTSAEVHLWHESTLAPAAGGPVAETPTASTVLTDATVDTLPGADQPPARWRLPAWVGSLVRLAFVAVVGSFVVAAWRRRPRWSGGALVAVAPAGVGPTVEVGHHLAVDADAQRAVLLEGAPRNAITACWLRLEDVVAATGLRRGVADTSTEFVRKVLAASTADADAINELAALFREARFSTHPMGERERMAALAALERVHRSLGGGSGPDGAPSAELVGV